jgi:hypothetical protein
MTASIAAFRDRSDGERGGQNRRAARERPKQGGGRRRRRFLVSRGMTREGASGEENAGAPLPARPACRPIALKEAALRAQREGAPGRDP